MDSRPDMKYGRFIKQCIMDDSKYVNVVVCNVFNIINTALTSVWTIRQTLHLSWRLG